MEKNNRKGGAEKARLKRAALLLQVANDPKPNPKPSVFKDIKNYNHLQISKHLIYLVDILKKIDEDITVGTLVNELFDFAGK